MNNKLLSDEVFVDKVKTLINKILMAESGRLVAAWEEFKQEVKIAAIERSCMVRYKEKTNEKKLQGELELLLSLESTRPGALAK